MRLLSFSKCSLNSCRVSGHGLGIFSWVSFESGGEELLTFGLAHNFLLNSLESLLEFFYQLHRNFRKLSPISHHSRIIHHQPVQIFLSKMSSCLHLPFVWWNEVNGLGKLCCFLSLTWRLLKLHQLRLGFLFGNLISNFWVYIFGIVKSEHCVVKGSLNLSASSFHSAWEIRNWSIVIVSFHNTYLSSNFVGEKWLHCLNWDFLWLSDHAQRYGSFF